MAKTLHIAGNAKRRLATTGGPTRSKITKSAIKHLARRGGVKRISGLLYEETRSNLNSFVLALVKDASLMTSHARRRTLKSADILRALERKGRTIYGY